MRPVPLAQPQAPPRPSIEREGTAILSAIGVYAVTTFLTIAAGLLVARHYAVADYGRLAYFSNLCGGLRLAAALGLTSQIIIELARRRGQDAPLAQGFYPLLWLRLATCGVGIVLTAIISEIAGNHTLTLAALAAGIALVGDFAAGALQGLGKVRLALAAQTVQPISYAVGAAAAVGFALPVEAVITIFALSFLVAVLPSAWWLLPIIGKPQGRADWRVLRDAVGSAGGMYLLAILGTVFTTCATLYLGTVGRFADAARLAVPLYLTALPASLAHTAITAIYFPRLVEGHARNAEDECRWLFNFFAGAISALGLLGWVGLALFPRTVLALLYGGRYDDSVLLLMLLAPLAFLSTLQSVLLFTTAGRGRLKVAILGSVLATGTLGLGVLLCAGHPADLIGFAVSYTVAALLAWVYQLLRLGMPYRAMLLRCLRQAGLAVLLVGAARLVGGDQPQHLLLNVGVAALAALLYGWWAWRDLGQGGRR